MRHKRGKHQGGGGAEGCRHIEHLVLFNGAAIERQEGKGVKKRGEKQTKGRTWWERRKIQRGEMMKENLAEQDLRLKSTC